MFRILNGVVRVVDVVEFIVLGIVNGLIWCGFLLWVMLVVLMMVLVDGLLEFMIMLVCLCEILFFGRLVFLMVCFMVM